MKKILVTGGAGFAGRHFVRHYLEQGDEVHCVDNILPATGAVHPQQSWPLFDPRDYSSFHFHEQDCREFFRNHRDSDFDYAFHLAAVVGGRVMIERDPLAVAEDLSIDSLYWRWAMDAKPAKTVYFSSSAAYPIMFQRAEGHRALTEDVISFTDQIGMPDLTYGWAKLTGEYLARIAFKEYGLKSAVYRPFSGYGEDQDLSYPFPAICRRVLTEKPAARLMVWGSGNQMRDFIHIDDCVRGVVETMDRIDDGSPLNLSTGIPTSFKTLAGIAADCAGYRPEVYGSSDKPEGVFARYGDTALQRQMGFVAGTKLRDGIARAVAYFEAALQREQA